MSKISIIVPMYNVESYISKCLESCIHQTLKDIEIIVIDDESKDKSLSIAQEYANKDKRIKVIKQKNSGVSVARNAGIDNSSSNWLMFVDGDDWLELNACEVMYNTVKKDDCDIMIGGFFEESIENSKKDKFLIYEQATFDKTNNLELVKNCIYKTSIAQPKSITNIGVPWAKLYKKSYIKNNNLTFKTGLKRMQDMVFNLSALYLANKIIYKDTPVYHYRCQNNSATNKFSPDFDITSESILKAIKSFIDTYNLHSELDDYYKIKAFLLFDEIIMLKYVPTLNKKSFNYKLKELHKLRKTEIYQKNTSIKLNSFLNFKLKIKNTLYCLNVIYPLYIINKLKYEKRNKKNYTN